MARTWDPTKALVQDVAPTPAPSVSSIKSTSTPLPTLSTSSAPSSGAEHPIGKITQSAAPAVTTQPVNPDAESYARNSAAAASAVTTQPVNPDAESYARNSAAAASADKIRTDAEAAAKNPVATSTTTPATQTNSVPQTAGLKTVVDGAYDQALKDSDTVQKQLDTLKTADVSAQGQLQNSLIDTANQKYATEQANNDRLEATQNQILKDRQAAVDSGAEQAKKEAQIAYDANQDNLRVSQMRTQQADQDRILNQQKSNRARELGDESRLAAMGGYGTNQAYTQMTNDTLENDRVINSLVMQADANNLDYANRFKTNLNEYNSALSSINVNKQKDIQGNYDKYLEYVTNIANNRELGATEKAAAISTAKANYTDKVAEINHNSFNDKYAKAWEVSEKSRTIQFAQRDDARLVMKSMLGNYALSNQDLTPSQKEQLNKMEVAAGYPVGSSLQGISALKEQARRDNLDMKQYEDDKGNVTYATVDKITGKLVSSFLIAGAAKTQMGRFSVVTNPLTLQQQIVDSSTGALVNANPSPADIAAVTSSGFFNPGSVIGQNIVAGKTVDEKSFNDTFRIGKRGGQCGDYATTISTAPRVGNTYAGKIDKVTTQEPTIGSKIILPLSVKDPNKDPGHVAVVVSYDAKTGDIGVVQSNIHLNGVVTKGVFNINKLKAAYGNNWGFIPGQLKSDISNSIQALPPSPAAQEPNINVEQKVVQAYMQSGTDLNLDPAAKAKAIYGYMQNGILPGSLSDLPTPQEYQANPSKYANLLPTQKASLLQNVSLEKATNPSSALNYSADSARSAFKNEAAVQVYDSIKPLSQAINNMNTDAANPNGIQDTAGFDATVQTVLGEITKQGATRAANGGIPTSKLAEAQQWLDQLTKNESLTDEQRKSALNIINTFTNSYTNQVKGLVGSYAQQAIRKNADPQDTILGYEDLYKSNSSSSVDASKIKQAVAAGHSSQDIVNHLAALPEYSDKIKQAISAGFSSDDIISYLSK